MWNSLVYYPRLNDERLSRFREKYDPSYPAYLEHMSRMIYPVLSDVRQDLIGIHLQRILDPWKSFGIHFNELFKSQDHWLLLGMEERNDADR